MASSDSIDKKCTSLVLYTLTPKKRDEFLKLYNTLHQDNPIIGPVSEIHRMSKKCPECEYKYELGKTYYCIKIKPKG
jgi:hypothetical protein